jgi:hypothetical protein
MEKIGVGITDDFGVGVGVFVGTGVGQMQFAMPKQLGFLQYPVITPFAEVPPPI